MLGNKRKSVNRRRIFNEIRTLTKRVCRGSKKTANFSTNLHLIVAKFRALERDPFPTGTFQQQCSLVNCETLQFVWQPQFPTNLTGKCQH